MGPKFHLNQSTGVEGLTFCKSSMICVQEVYALDDSLIHHLMFQCHKILGVNKKLLGSLGGIYPSLI